jgi:hypothetical protein
LSDEHPFDAATGGVALGILGSDLSLQRLAIANAAVEALAAQDVDLNSPQDR